MQQDNGWLVEELGHPAEDDIEGIPNCLIAISPEEEQWGSPFHLLALESSENGPVPFRARNTVKKDLALGTGGALLAHALVAITISLIALVKPLPHSPGPVICVYLTGADLTGHGSGDSAGVASVHVPGNAGEPENIVTRETEVVPEQPKTSEAREHAFPMTSADTRKPAARPKRRNQPRHDIPMASSNGNSPAPKETIPRDAATGLEEEQGKSMASGNETGEASGISRAGVSPSSGGIRGEYEAAGVDQVPQVIRKVEPAYPLRARTLDIRGRVVVRFLVEPDGRVSKPAIVEAHPKGYFEQNTLDAIRQWRFKPGSFRGHVVATWVTLPVQFRLTDQD